MEVYMRFVPHISKQTFFPLQKMQQMRGDV